MTSRRTIGDLRDLIRKCIPDELVAEHTQNEHWYRHVPSGYLLPSVTTITSILQSPHLKRWAANLAVEYLDTKIRQSGPLTELDAQLKKAAVLAHEDVFHDAGDIGTQGHGVLEAYTKEWLATGHRPPDIQKFITGTDARLWAIARSANKFYDDYFALPIASEIKVYFLPNNPEYGFAGTLDSLMWLAFPEGKIDEKCEHNINLMGSNLSRLGCIACDSRWQYYFTLVDYKTSNTIDDKDEYVMQVAAYWRAVKSRIGIAPQKCVILQLNKEREKYNLLEIIAPHKAFKVFEHLQKVHLFARTPTEFKTRSLTRDELIDFSQL